MSTERIIRLSRLVPEGHWTTYGTISEIVYGHKRGAQTVGSVIRAEGTSTARTERSGPAGRLPLSGAELAGERRSAFGRLRRDCIWEDNRVLVS